MTYYIDKADNIFSQLKADNSFQRFGSAVLQTNNAGVSKIVGFFESRNISLQQSLYSDQYTEMSSFFSESSQEVVQQVSSMGSETLGGLTSLGWANLAVSAINLGVTVVGMVGLSKKMSALSRDMQVMNGKVDRILSELHQMKHLLIQLNDNETRKLYSEANRQVKQIKDCISELTFDRYDSSVRREAKRLLIDSSVFLEDLISRYSDSSCNIMLGLDVIMGHFYSFVSLLKTYISTVYLHEKELVNYAEYDDALKNICSKNMVTSIESVYMKASPTFISPTDLSLITSIFKGITIEQIRQIKSQKSLIEFMDYNDYKHINDQMANDADTQNTSYIRFE